MSSVLDLALVLGVLADATFEPLESVLEKMLTLIDFVKESRKFAAPVSCLFLPRLCSR